MEPLVNARLETIARVLGQRVDRIEELNRLRVALIKKKGNVFLYGPRGVGKTFLLKMLEHELSDKATGTFTFYFPLDVQLAIMANREREASCFPVAFALSLVSAAWGALVRGKHRDLNKAVEWEARRLGIQDELHATIVELRRSLLTTEAEGGYERKSDVGASALFKANTGEKTKRTRKMMSLLPSEVHDRIGELTAVMTKECGIKRVVALCDEANMLPDEWQRRIIGSHLRVLGDIGLQFVFVAGFVPWMDNTDLPDYFDDVVELKGLSIAASEELVDKVLGSDGFYFESGAIKALHTFTSGNPRQFLGIAWDATQHAGMGADKCVTESTMKNAIRRARKELVALKKTHPAIGIGSPIAEAPSLTTGRTDRVSGGSAVLKQ